MDEILSQRSDSAHEQLQHLNLYVSHNTADNTNQTVSEQTRFSQTRNTAQTLPEQQQYSLHTESNTLNVHELRELPPHPVEPGQFRNEYADEGTRTAVVTEENPFQLPFRVNIRGLG
jgi:hypothetical protein